MRKVAGSLRVDLAQFRALEAFAMFASDLDAASRAQLARGERLVEVLKQPQYTPYPMEDQAVAIWLGTSGELDAVPTADVRRFETELLDHLRRNSKVLDAIRESREFTGDTEVTLKVAVHAFKLEFQTSDGKAVVVGKESAAALDEAKVEQEQIVRQKHA
jgi:F-type H+-transporting ATPase subunit alpha